MFANYKSTLIENFNTTNQSSPLCLAHDNFVTDIHLPSCGMVQTLPPHERCKYVKATEQCSEDVFLFDYVKFFFCNIDSGNPYMVVLTLFSFIWVIATLFLILGSTADGFFCPSLKVLSVMMGLNENVAGVTLLAFGNCAPDFITNITGLNSESRRIYSDTFGGAFFVVFGVAGLIMTFVPFVTQGSNFLRDCCFLILAVVYIDFVFHTDESINVREGILILIIYFFYISVVVIDQYLIVRKLRELRNRNDLDTFNSEIFESLSRAANFEIISANSRASRISQALGSSFDYPGKKYANSKLFQQLLISINPIDMNEWEESDKIGKAFMIVKSPILLFLRCLIPVVDYELGDYGWSKLLNCIQCVTLPMFVLFATMDFYIFNLPLWALSSFVTLPLSILLFLKSRTDKTPSFQKNFAIISAVGSVYIIYSCAAETISVLNVLGLVLHRSNSFLGCTLLAWGNSIGDLVSNISLARSGYQKMSFAACFGGPLFNILIGVGMGMTYKAATSPELKTNKMNVADGTMGENTTIFMAIGLSILLFAACSTNFVMRRSLGIFMLLIYILYFVVTLLGELEIIHTYGSDHRLDLKVEPADF